MALLTIALVAAGRGSGLPTLQAQPPTNPIVTENALPGSPQGEWDVTGAGDPTIQGYATDISVNRGNIVSFKIKLAAAAPGYVIDIYRLGYYQGFGARKVATVVPSAGEITAAKSQPDCLTDASSGLVDCGNWSVSGSFNTTGMTSGVFLARPRRTDTSGASHIVFIVRDDARTADLVFQTSDTTWVAYNQYPGLANGGGSLYCNGPMDNSAGDYACANRAAKVSYNRPIDTREHNATSWLFNAEYPMLRWLEANGYDMKYWTGIDTDRFGADAQIGLTSARKPKAFFSVGHDEYWSGQQRTNVELARNAGVNLAFFSGNEMFWKTRYEASIDGSNTAYRTLVNYKETFSNGAARLDPNPSNPWTGTWRDPRFSPPLDGGRPENELIGQIWTVNCCSARLIVPSSMKHLRFWRNTPVASLLDGEVYAMPTDTLGYEWDEDLDNGFRPQGLIHMSETTTPVDQKLLDFGTNVGPGVATHHLTMYRHNSGALVFGAGTVQWSWGLDGNHDRTVVAPDRAMQQATVNLLADMGAQPLTLQLGADGVALQPATMSTDIFGPSSTITAPANGASVPSGSRVTVTGTATEHGGGGVAGVEISVDGGTTWKKAQLDSPTTWSFDWQPGAVGAANVRSRAIDDSGNMESAGIGITVNIVTGDCPCTSLWKPSTVPGVASAADGEPVELGLKFYSDIDGFITGVRFYKGPANNSTHVGNLWTSGGTLLARGTFANETATGWQQMLFTTPVAITANTTYVVSYHTNVGGYAADGAYFASAGVDSPPLHASAGTVVGGNGVFGYGATQFPANTFNNTNYWVDVVFSPTISDQTAPVVTKIKSTLVDSSRVTITWTTDEDATSTVKYGTDPELLASPTANPPGTQTVTQTAFVKQHSVPLAGLSPNTTYYYRVISTDRSGNAANVAAPTFTLPGPTLRDTSATDFAAGASTGTYVAENKDGEITLAPTKASEFSGTTMTPGWIATPWDSGGFASVGNGRLFVDGSRVGTCEADGFGGCIEQSTQMPGHRLEFVATFSGDAFQHAGFGQLLTGPPFAIFSTGTGGTLMARSLTVSGLVANDEIPNGASFLGQPHRYTIDWKADRVEYSIDGVLVKTHAFAVEGPMRPIAASDFSIFGGAIVVDWMRMSPYAATGTFESRIFDAGSSVNWNTIQWHATTPAGTNMAISVRVGDSPTPGAGWTAWEPIAGPGALALSSRYIQYQATLTTTDVDVTPTLDDLIISTGHAPVAADDAIVVPQNGVTTLPPTGAASLTNNDTDADGDPLQVVAASGAAHGTLLVLEDGSVRYTPETNYSGPDAFTYTVSDGLMTDTATVTVEVRFGNIAPVANHDFYTASEDTVLSVLAANGLLKNDTDVEHDVLSAVLTSLPAHGMLTLNGLGGFTYTPALNYAGPDSFTYQAYDGQASSELAMVTINVLPVNDAPISEPDSYVAVMNQALTIAAKGVLANDHDVEVEDTAPLRAQLVSQPSHGTLTFNSDGSFSYTPNADFLGADSFTYAAVDHFDAVGNTTTVTLTTALKAVAQTVNGGGTVDTGTDVTPTNPLASAVTTPSAATISIAQGVIAASQPPSGYTFLNQQVNITILNQDGSELIATAANPIRMAFSIDGTLLLPGEDETSIQMFRNGVLIPNCLGQTSIPAANLDPCITARELLGGDARITVLTTHASRWNMGLSTALLGTAPHAVNDGVYEVDYQTPLVIAASGVLGNDYGRNGLTAVLSEGSEIGGSVVLSPSGAFLFMPGAGVCGPASFKYRASDGTDTSNEATVSVAVDCTPVANPDAVTILEDSGTNSITVLSNDTDPDPGQILKVTAVGTAAHGLTSIMAGGMAVNYAPAADFFGDDSFQYTISDGRGGTATGTVTVHVSAVNDAPSFVKGANQALNEDAAAQSIANWATSLSAGPANESAQAIDFVVVADAPSLFAVQPAVSSNGTLTFTPAPDANGVATISVKAHDNGGVANDGRDSSDAQSFTITVTAVNDAPSFVKGADQAVPEDSAAQSVAGWATAISAGPGDEASQSLAFSITGNSNVALFAAGPSVDAAGTLTYTPAPNASGSATLTISLKDDGGTANGGVDTSAPETFVITVANVNDAPSFVKGADVTVAEDSGAKTSAAWATAISAGPSDESGQAVDFLVTSSNSALFSAQPAISAAGDLTFTPAANANGVATVTVRLHDDGGTAGGGVDTSAAQTFTITVTAVNDAPSFVKGADQSVIEDASQQTVAGWATGISAGPADESGQAVAFSVIGNSNPSLFAVQPAVSPNGTLTYTPAAGANGVATITVSLKDDGGTASGGVDTSAPQAFAISVVFVNDAPSFVKGADQVLFGNSGPRTVASWATAISAGPADEAGQAVAFTVTNNNTALFAAQPAVSPTGTLTYTPATDVTGSATVTVVLKDNGGVLNGGVDTSAPQTFTISVNKASTATVLASSNATSLFGVEIALTATVADIAPGLGLPSGTVTFRNGTTVLGSSPVVNGVAVFKTSTLPVGTLSLTALYTPTGNFLGSTSLAFSQVIKPSAKLLIDFTVHSLLDGSSRPKVQDVAVSGAEVKVYTRLDRCTDGLIVLNVPFLWGRIFDGWDGVGGNDAGCEPVQVGTYEAVGITDADGKVTIFVPPTSSSPNTDYIVIARTTKFDYIKTAASADPLYSQYKQSNINANQAKKVSLHQLATFNGKILSAKSTEYFGSYLGLVEPENVEWTDDTEVYPFVMVTEGAWEVTTAVQPPDGFVADQPALSATAADTTTAVQFTLTDIGSDWTETVVNHTIGHLGTTTTQTSTIPMVNKRPTKARPDTVKMMVTDGSVSFNALANDRLGYKATTFSLTSFTQPVNGTVTAGGDGISFVYVPAAGFDGTDSFTYTITDDTGYASTGTVTVKVYAIPTVNAGAVTVTEDNSGLTPAVLAVTLSNPSTVPVTVSYETVDGTATAGSDYMAKTGTLTIDAGATRGEVAIGVLGDVEAEAGETFTVRLSNPVNATLAAASDGQVKIADDEVPFITVDDVSATEGTYNTSVWLTVKLSDADSTTPITVNYKTVSGTARALYDFVPKTGQLYFGPGGVSNPIEITLVGDTSFEATEEFYVELSSPTNATLGQTRAAITILNDDTGALVATTPGDFEEGTLGGGATIIETADGEIALAASMGSEFSGEALPAGWAATALDPAGSALVGGGAVQASGASLLGGLTTVGTGHNLEFVATFSGRNQAVGLGAGTLDSPLAVFMVKGDNELYAVTIAPTSTGVLRTTETYMAGIDWLRKPHTYSIDWVGTKAVYRIDGGVMASHSGAAWGSLEMGPMIVDSVADATSVSVNYMRLPPYAASGSFSKVFDSGDAATAWTKLVNTVTMGSGTAMQVSYRIGDTATPDESWSVAKPLATTGGALTGTGRYIEISVQMSASLDGKRTPTLKEMSLTFKLP